MRRYHSKSICFSLWLLLLVLPVVFSIRCGEPGLVVNIPAPPETRVEAVADVLHGVEIVDRYRWLEDQESPETRAWIDAQNAYTNSIMEQLPGREKLQRRLTELTKVDTISIPVERGSRYFYRKRAADQELFVWYMREGRDGEERILLDPHPLSEDHSVSINLRDVSDDGKLVAYGIRQGGVDESEIHFLDVDTGEQLPDMLESALFYFVTFNSDNTGYYYVRRDPEGTRLYYRQFGSGPESEKLIFGEGLSWEQFIFLSMSEDRRWMVINHTIELSRRNDLYLKDLTNDGDIIPLVTGKDAIFNAGVYADKLIISTNWNAPNNKLMIANLDNPGVENWREFVPESDSAVLEQFSAAGGKLFVRYLENVQSRVVILDIDGNELGEIAFDTIGTVGGMAGRWGSNEAFFTFNSYHIPTTIYRYDVSTGEKEVWESSEIPVESDDYVLKQVWYESKDGAKVPMFVLHARDLELNGNNPAYLTAYGGFGASLTPRFSSTAVAWVESGGIYAEASIRGGGEFGEEWHRAGMLGNKQNVFDDFIAAGEFLISEGYTKPEKLAIEGISNGGLLVTAAVTQRPDLFGAVVCGYPLIDMIRYHKFLLGATWVSEYGSADNPEQFPFILEYSPYQHVEKGVEYPAVLFTTGDGDTRVAPLHARKMAALMQASTSSGKPIMLRYHTKAGHAGGMTVSQQIEDDTDTLLFLLWQLGVTAG